MFKVMCIDASKGRITGEVPPFKEGEVLTAKQSLNFKDSYYIMEYLYDLEFGLLRSWHKIRFIPLSDLDETVIHAQVVEDLKTIKTI